MCAAAIVSFALFFFFPLDARSPLGYFGIEDTSATNQEYSDKRSALDGVTDGENFG